MTDKPEVAAKPVADAVNRFLAWPLPKTFAPDCGISFDGRKDDEWNKNKTWPIGTNLFTADEARAMFEHCFSFNPDWSLLEAAQDSLREYMKLCRKLTDEVAALKSAPLYAVPPEVPPRAMEVLRGLFASIDEHFAGRHDDACPWHSHLTPGVWDNDSGNRRAGKAGTLCSDCVTWSAARALLQHDAPPTLRSTPELLAAFRDGVQPGIITVVHDVPPREPTPEMLKAGAGWQDLGDQEDNACQAKLTWQAMYDAFKHDAATGRPDAAARASAEDAT